MCQHSFMFFSGSVINNAYAKYATGTDSNTQTQANSNECPTGTNYGITSPQTQGDGTANSPTNLQISKFNEASRANETAEQGGGVGGGVGDDVDDVDTTLTVNYNCESSDCPVVPFGISDGSPQTFTLPSGNGQTSQLVQFDSGTEYTISTNLPFGNSAFSFFGDCGEVPVFGPEGESLGARGSISTGQHNSCTLVVV